MQETDLSYIAGLIDLTGYIGITRQYQLVIRMRIRDRDVANWLFDHAGGSVHFRRFAKPGSGHWEWQMGAGEGVKLLALVRPYLKSKGQQADLGIRYQAEKLWKTHDKQWRQQQYVTMRLLNRWKDEDEE